MKVCCKIAALTDIGRQRVRNEDNYLVLQDYSLVSVADGMGGHVDGDIASTIAVETLKETYEKHYREKISDSQEKEPLANKETFLKKAIEDANDNICNENKGMLSIEDMGTTIVVLQLVGENAIIAWVGDSRIYRLRDKKFSQVTQDHSLIGELAKYNLTYETDLMFFHSKNIITRALGMTNDLSVDTCIDKVQNNDVFLLCSDGLTDLVDDSKIHEIINKNNEDLEKAVKELVDTANENGGQDNITVILLKTLFENNDGETNSKKQHDDEETNESDEDEINTEKIAKMKNEDDIPTKDMVNINKENLIAKKNEDKGTDEISDS